MQVSYEGMWDILLQLSKYNVTAIIYNIAPIFDLLWGSFQLEVVEINDSHSYFSLLF